MDARGVAWSEGPPRVEKEADGERVGDAVSFGCCCWLDADGHSCYVSADVVSAVCRADAHLDTLEHGVGVICRLYAQVMVEGAGLRWSGGESAVSCTSGVGGRSVRARGTGDTDCGYRQW